MTEHFDTLETRDPEVRERAMLAALPEQIAHAKAHAPAFARILADVDAAAITTRAALAQLPVTRKSELLDLQKAARPFGGFARHAMGRWRGACSRVRGRCTSRKAPPPDYWRLARAMYAAGFRRGDLVHNCFAYHFTPAGSMMRDRRARARLHRLPGRHRPDRTAGAGDGRPAAGRLRRHAVVPEDHPGEGRRAARRRCRRCARRMVSGEAFPPRLRDCLADARHRRLPGYATADLGMHRLRIRGARGPGRRRRRAGRDRAPGHRRPGGAGARWAKWWSPRFPIATIR